MDISPEPLMQKRSRKLAHASLVIGIIALVFLAVPFAGIVLGLIAVILGIIATTKTKKTKAIAGIIIGSIAVILGAVATLLVIYLVTGAAITNNSRTEAVNRQIAEKKDFTAQETAKLGTINLKITKVERNYTPTAEESKETPPSRINSNAVRTSAADEDPTLLPYKEYTDSLLTKDNDIYVAVDAEVTLNGDSSPGHGGALSSLWLNYYSPYVYTVTYGNNKSFSTSEPSYTHSVYRVKKDAPALILYYRVTIDRYISPIFGTEGSPSVKLLYTITL